MGRGDRPGGGGGPGLFAQEGLREARGVLGIRAPDEQEPARELGQDRPRRDDRLEREGIAR